MRAVELDLAVARRAPAPVVAQVAHQVVQQRERAVVRPVQVVEHQQHAALGAPGPGEAGRPRRTGAAAPRAVASGGAPGVRARASLRSRARAARARPAVSPSALAQRVGRRASHPAAQRLDERQVGRGRLELVAAAAQHLAPAELRGTVISCASRVLPTPGSPDSSARWPWPCAARESTARAAPTARAAARSAARARADRAAPAGRWRRATGAAARRA